MNKASLFSLYIISGWNWKARILSPSMASTIPSELVAVTVKPFPMSFKLWWWKLFTGYSFPTSYNYYSNFPHKNPLIPFIKEIKTPLLIGGSYEKNREKQEYCNSAFMFDKYGNFRGYYGKNHLVPFAESLPFREYPVIGWLQDILHIQEWIAEIHYVGPKQSWTFPIRHTLWISFP